MSSNYSYRAPYSWEVFPRNEARVVDADGKLLSMDDVVELLNQSHGPNGGQSYGIEEIMALVDEYADAFHTAMRPDGGIGFAEGFIAKGKKDAIRAALKQSNGSHLRQALQDIADAPLNRWHSREWMRERAKEALSPATNNGGKS